MKQTSLGIAVAALVAWAGSCAPGIRVQTIVSPDAGLGLRHMFRILPVPAPSGGGSLTAGDPMRVNSITNRALRDALVQGFERRGYVQRDSHPDFAVAYYVSTREHLDVTYWDYGYPWWPRWRGRGHGWSGWTVTRYTEGTVIVDVVDPESRELLWRGRAVAAISPNVEQYADDLRRTVAALLERFPQAQPATVAGH